MSTIRLRSPMDYETFFLKIHEIESLGYVQSHRKGPTGIGKTLEDLLGIKENNIAGPDLETHELKSARKSASAMLTLFTKTPSPKGAIQRLLDAYGYRQRKWVEEYIQTRLVEGSDTRSKIPFEDKEIHITLDASTPNSLGLVLIVTKDRIYISGDKAVEAYYERDALRSTFERKYHNLIYVLAECRKEEELEFFHYDEAYRLDGFSFRRFSKLVEEGIIKLDLRVGHYPDGRVHDHGTAFRVLRNQLPLCFENTERIV